MSVLEPIKTTAPMPLMHRDVAAAFNKLREFVRENSGVDFLARCGDVLRSADFVSTKDGVANNSWHKTGRAFDYDQTQAALIIVSDVVGGQQYFRTYLKCKDQTGKQGLQKTLVDIRGNRVNAYVFDFTAAADSHGFKRIPAWKGWQSNYIRREFWHYEKRDGLSWAQAMAQISGTTSAQSNTAANMTVYKLNSKGEKVKAIQAALHCKKLLDAKEIDGIFGQKTKAAVIALQRSVGLSADGIVGKDTLKALGI